MAIRHRRPTQPPSQTQRTLTDVPASAQFRVAVVAPDHSGLLFGLTRPIKPPRQSADDNGANTRSSSLLDVEPRDDLDQEVWRLDFGDGADGAVLQVNNTIPDIVRLVSADPQFRSLVFPQVLRTILQHIVLVEQLDPDDPDGDQIWADWIALAKRQTGGDIPQLTDTDNNQQRRQALDWIETAVKSFAAAQHVAAADTYTKAAATQ